MQISAKTEYACLAVLELAMVYSGGEPLQVRKIAAAHQIPAGFLVQILLQLKNSGLVTSTRGASGGYRLTRAPDEISIWDVMVSVEGEARVGGTSASSPTVMVLQEVWEEAACRSRELLTSTTFARLAERVRGASNDMYYI